MLRLGVALGLRLNACEEWWAFRQAEAKLKLPRDIDDLVEAATLVSAASAPQEILRSVPDFDIAEVRAAPWWGCHSSLRSIRESIFRLRALRVLFARAIVRHLRGEPLPEDPFSPGATPRSIEIDGRLQALWSVGRNGHDDGGAGDYLILLRRPRLPPK